MKSACRQMLKRTLPSLLFTALLIKSQYATAQQLIKAFTGIITNEKGESLSAATASITVNRQRTLNSTAIIQSEDGNRNPQAGFRIIRNCNKPSVMKNLFL
jgi:hypothetical protein